MKHAPLKLMEKFFARLEAQNKTLAEWARESDFDLNLVYQVSRGRIHGRRGQSRVILKAMGVEPPPMFGPGKARRASKAEMTA